MTIYITGDIHGKPIERLSFRKHAGMRNLTNQDTLVVLGDFGVPFGINAPYYKDFFIKSDIYKLNWLISQKYTILVVAGNHDDRDAIRSMPIVSKWGGQVRQMYFNKKLYDNIFVVDTPQILTIDGNKCLCIPGADSHDIDHGILDPSEPNFKKTLKEWSKDKFKLFRVNHWNWWEDEAIDVSLCKELESSWKEQHFDCIFTHDYPAHFNSFIARGMFRVKNTEAQEYLEHLRKTLNFDSWFFGHIHFDLLTTPADDRLLGLFESIISLEEEEGE